ncbi:hypothetical protein [Halopiger xanaduensis]|uniref:Uncharacterized protein n=1 Tax=Halopiger xanaduensis (strain DSM 18323 / JCM 14033 / SH-6) TaxID=797210 RepID=F8DEM9_HALXS|nr:hypothetical protein [Halopiger xanaduensis]AEH39466.1 hypothetical protein Halxa_0226 [Halopiger xanaduensis SH-6]
MTSLDPSNYGRDATAAPTNTVRYRGPCRRCEEPTQATCRFRADQIRDHVWVRCRDCGAVTRIAKSPINGEQSR